MADVNLSISEYVHMVVKYNLLLLNGCHAGAHDIEHGQHQYEGYDLQDDAWYLKGGKCFLIHIWNTEDIVKLVDQVENTYRFKSKNNTLVGLTLPLGVSVNGLKSFFL